MKFWQEMVIVLLFAFFWAAAASGYIHW